MGRWWMVDEELGIKSVLILASFFFIFVLFVERVRFCVWMGLLVVVGGLQMSLSTVYQ